MAGFTVYGDTQEGAPGGITQVNFKGLAAPSDPPNMFNVPASHFAVALKGQYFFELSFVRDAGGGVTNDNVFVGIRTDQKGHVVRAWAAATESGPMTGVCHAVLSLAQNEVVDCFVEAHGSVRWRIQNVLLSGFKIA
jgi:hypothetical protein